MMHKSEEKKEGGVCDKLLSKAVSNPCLLWSGAIVFYLLPLLLLFLLHPSSPLLVTRVVTFLVASIAAVRFVDQVGYPVVHTIATWIGKALERLTEPSSSTTPEQQPTMTTCSPVEKDDHADGEKEEKQDEKEEDEEDDPDFSRSRHASASSRRHSNNPRANAARVSSVRISRSSHTSNPASNSNDVGWFASTPSLSAQMSLTDNPRSSMYESKEEPLSTHSSTLPAVTAEEDEPEEEETAYERSKEHGQPQAPNVIESVTEKLDERASEHPFSWRLFLGTGYCYVILLWLYSQISEDIGWSDIEVPESLKWRNLVHLSAVVLVFSLAILFAFGAWCAVRISKAVWRWLMCEVRRIRESKGGSLSCASVCKYLLIAFFSLSLCVVPSILLLIMHPPSPVLMLRLGLLCCLLVSGDCFVHELFSLRARYRGCSRFDWTTFSAGGYFWMVMAWVYGILKRKLEIEDDDIDVFLPTSLPLSVVLGVSVVFALGAWCTAGVAQLVHKQLSRSESLRMNPCLRRASYPETKRA
eukprot:gb/GECG01001060.1/.p1 GENE.gb/GECG01001060.1/~~gb/GECG01001060.1/.p1  ORF type:complete len:528 (+),score=56.86 gb/GECG01001060.1/:1-1584(+)